MKHLFISLPALLTLSLASSTQAANTENDYPGSTSALGTSGNWSLGHVATVSEDANFNGFSSITTATITNTAMNWGSLNLTAGPKTITIGNSSTIGDSSLTLGGVGSTGNSVAGSASGDLIYAASGNILNIQNTVGSGTKLLNLVLGQSGNFDIVGTAAISSAISDGGSAYGFTKTGTGTLTLTGANTYTGTTTVNTGTLTLGSGGSLATTSTLATGGNGIFNFSGAAAASQTLAGLNANQGFGTVNNTVSGTTLSLGPVTHSAGGMLYFGNTTGNINTSSASGIIGSWAFLGSGATLDYAASNGAGVAISSLGASTTLPSGGPGVSTTNYTLAGAQTQTVNTVGNTLRYTGTAQTLGLGTTSLGLKGVMNAGTGLLTISGTALNPGLVTTGELDLATNTQGITISSVISGAGSVVSGGVGTTVATSSTAATGLVTLSGANTYNGGTVINSGALRASTSTALGTGNVTVTNGAQLQLNGAVSINNTININGASALFSVTGGGTPNLTGIVNLQSNSSINLATNSGNAAMTLSGTLNLNGNILSANTINVNPAITISGIINGAGGIAEGGNGVLVISNNNSGTYSGTTTLSGNGATLQLGNDGALGSGALSLNATSATLTVRSADATGHSLSNALVLGGNVSTIYTFGAAATFTGNLTFTNSTPIALSTVRTFNVLNAQTQINAGLTGAGGITKSGAGALVLTGTSGYTGATTLNAGVLQADGSLNASSAVGVGGAGASGTPTLSGAGTVNGAVTLNAAGGGAAGTINPGTVGGVGTLTVGSISFQNGSTFAVDLNSSTSDRLTINGAATLAGTNNITFTGTTGATTTSGVGNYVLATIGSGSNLTTGAFTGTVPTNYRLLGTGTQLNLTHQATIGTITATPASADIITGGTTAFDVTVSNTAPTGSSSLSAGGTSGTNTTGSITTGTIVAAAGATSGSASGLTFNGTTVGAGQTGNFSITDPNADNTPQTGNVTVNVHGHASGSLSGSTLDLGPVHVGYTAPVTSSNSVTASNAAGYLVNLAGSAAASGNVSVNSVSGVAAGGTSGAITAILATGQGLGAISTPLTYTFADSSALSGASSNVGTAGITVSGQVYSGTSTWNTNGSGAWGTVASGFGANWGTNQGSPGLDSGFTNTDTATFDNTVLAAGSSATVSLNGAAPSLNAITFGASGGGTGAGYTVAPGSGGSISLAGNGGNATVTNSGTNGSVATISAPVSLTTSADVNVASGQTINFSGAVSGSGSLNTVTGAGITKLSNASGNTYTGGTFVTGGKLYVNNTTGSGTGTGAVSISGGTVAGSGNITTGGGVSVTSGGTLSSGDIQSGTTVDGTHLTVTNTSVSIASANLTFNLGAGTTSGSGFHTFDTPNTNTTYMTLAGTSSLNFSGTDSVSLIDLTDGGLLSLRLGTPYLLVDGTSNSQYTGLVTSIDGSLANLALNGNGFVMGVGTLSSYTAISINQFGSDGVTPLTGGSSYVATVLYLNNGDLEVVPEPGTWALMLGGLALLVFVQRRKQQQL